MPQHRKRPGKVFLFSAFVVVALLLGILMLRRYQGRTMFPSPGEGPATGSNTVTLFFASPAGDRLVREAREVDPCRDTADCITTAVDELVNGPLGELAPVVPGGAVLEDVTVEDDVATLDFSPQLRSDLSGSPVAERLAVFAIVDTVTFNFPEIHRVKILIAGESLPTLKGGLDLSRPLAPDFSLEK